MHIKGTRVKEVTENFTEVVKNYYWEMFGNIANHLVIILHDITHETHNFILFFHTQFEAIAYFLNNKILCSIVIIKSS